jgi:hypothetical protein
MPKIRGSRVSVPDPRGTSHAKEPLEYVPQRSDLAACPYLRAACLRGPQVTEKQRIFPCRQVACFQRFLAKSEAGDLLYKWA